MQAPRPSGPVRQAQRRRGDVLPQRHLMAMLGGQLPRVPDGQHHQVPGGVDLDLAGGGEMQGQGHPHPPMAALAGDDLDFISRMSYSSGHNPYSALEHTSNENSFVNGLRFFSFLSVGHLVAEACALYKAEDEHEKAFQFMHCWNKLRTQPKWLAKLDELAAARTGNKKRKRSSNGDPNETLPIEIRQDDAEGVEANVLTRPIGKKKAKAALIQEKKKSVTSTLENMWAQKKETDEEKEVKKEERFKKAFALEEERVANEKRLVEVRIQEVQLQKKRDEERIMTMDLTALPDEQKKYYMCLQTEIMRQFSIRE
ncbi:hypothetical protein GUJ93_ZPchr0005g14611 [Zizania palustris]|uniref:No apical meristem-associated C-terminal domain-containing protein n=1 Tax=Zizania palustris TaxID=103762 RepID=A0A8J5W0P6_ZIZPA|nr:hypothetical protein GUJ93_ZPchr0005g14611 [Zizania palustris]